MTDHVTAAPTGPEEAAPLPDVLADLRCAGRTVARYATRPGLDPRLSPRPYLHPVTTLGGAVVTEELPGDHLHHLGAGLAVPDVDGRNFWGGRTFVRDRGPVPLDNHGTQRHTGWRLREAGRLEEDLVWEADGVPLLHEHRTVTATALTDRAWALGLTFALTPADGPVTIGSPATNGRPGAGYGGFFWRAPKEAEAPSVFTRDADGEEAVHGRGADWIALAGDGWTLVFAAADGTTRRDPWFVRTTEYPGVGSSLAWSRPLTVPAGRPLVRRLVTVVADGRPGRQAVEELVKEATAR
ncbi:PmoA family protein [Streptomyces sp. UH6]|uniref:DUF6807 domain-containing protein n=1 Tax=Streptomyces sp. UH6 TaxID=2748379 RepID=UPI0015D48D6B|nr:PmoA family protein [Streptomyces sp. UH6]NYV77775.1 PmoA family protein [Streptomyces sp. UH6]